jgi:ribosomal-protein-alanine N-acetyltransferase
MTLFPETMRTPRLRYERLDDAVDAFDRYAWTRDGRDARERETAYVTQTPDPHPRATRDELAGAGDAWADAEGAKWAICLRPGEPDADGDPVAPGESVHVGVASLDALWDRRRVHTGVSLYRPYWGRGYAGERAPALLKVAFDVLDLDVASVAHFAGNENSQRQMETWVDRYGGTEDGYFRHWVPRDGGEAEPWDLRSYSITAADYHEHGGAPAVELEPDDVPEPTPEPTTLDRTTLDPPTSDEAGGDSDGGESA